MRWRVSVWLLRAAVAVMPRGTARDRFGDYVRAWCIEMRRAGSAQEARTSSTSDT
jgi:hypothetical protein